MAERPLTAEEQRLWKQYRRIWTVATLLLLTVFSLAVFATLLEPLYPWMRFLRGFAEAATVGALADWFAVTALFRHPLGLPIPHTAILPAKKRQLAESLGIFLENNFLEPALLRQRLQQLNLLNTIANLLEQAQPAIQQYATTFVQRLLQHLGKERWMEQLLHHFRSLLPAWNISRWTGKLLSFLVEQQLHTLLLNELLSYGETWLKANRQMIYEFLLSRIPWYIPRPFRNNVAQYLTELLERFIAEVRNDPHHPLRRQIEKFLLDLAIQLQESEVYQEKLRSLLSQLLEHPEAQSMIQNISQQLNAALYQFVEQSPEKLEAAVQTLLHSVIQFLRQQDPVNTAMNKALIEMLQDFITQHRSSLRTFIVSVVERWDDQEFVRRIELYTGRDLQFIRINGTLVGGTIGLLLTIVLELIR